MYKKVHVLLIHWIEAEESEFEKQLSALEEVFQDFYTYETSRLPIPSESPETFLRNSFDDFLKEHDHDQFLLIIYYGGHGQLKDGGLIWTCLEREEDPFAKWYILQHAFLDDCRKADILFLLDCCHAGGSIHKPNSTLKNVVDVISACSAKAKTPVRGDNSLTSKLIKAFKANFAEPFSCRYLYSQLLYRRKLEEDLAACLADDIGDEQDTYPQWFPLRTNRRDPRTIVFSRIEVLGSKIQGGSQLPAREPAPSSAIDAKLKEFARLQTRFPERSTVSPNETSGNKSRKMDQEVHQSQEWFQRYKRMEHIHMVQRLDLDLSRLPCKVSIIATGINLRHPMIEELRVSGEIGDLVDFTEGGEGDGHCDDIIGLGTDCVQLISQLASCRIYVAKTFKDNKAREGDNFLIKHAIEWSVTVWDVDIIILPFGLKHADPHIADAVSLALSKDVVCLAASGNSGANEKLPFPARLPGVLSIYATDGFGNPAPYNPSPQSDRKNFSTLGSSIEMYGDSDERQVRSGTSYAVSIAGGILAAMFMYASEVLHLHARDLKVLRSPKGAERLFELMSSKRGGYDYFAPWLLLPEGDPTDSLEVQRGLIKAKLIAHLREI